MNKQERARLIRRMGDLNESITYLQELVMVTKGIDLEILNKNLHYAVKQKEEVCKKIGFGGSTSSSTTSQRLEGKA